MEDTLEWTGQAPESEPLIRGRIDHGGTAGDAKENRQAAGNRDATSAGQVGTPWTTPSTATATPVGATYIPSCEGDSPKREMRPTERTWERTKSSQCGQRGQKRWHEQKAMP